MWPDEIVVMLLTHDFWKTFTSKAIPHAKESAQVVLAISRDSRFEVDAILEGAAAQGGKANPNARQEHGSMYGRSFKDPDGHIWEPLWMDPNVAAGREAPVEHMTA